MRKPPCIALLLLVSACGSSDDEPPLVCHLGELTGTWRTTYEERDGTCGPLPAETVSLSPSDPGGGTGGCKYATDAISADKCRYDFDYTCPTTDGKGTQRWTGVTRQVEEGKLTGDTSVQLVHPELGTCRSTYTVTLAKL